MTYSRDKRRKVLHKKPPHGASRTPDFSLMGDIDIVMPIERMSKEEFANRYPKERNKVEATKP